MIQKKDNLGIESVRTFNKTSVSLTLFVVTFHKAYFSEKGII